MRFSLGMFIFSVSDGTLVIRFIETPVRWFYFECGYIVDGSVNRSSSGPLTRIYRRNTSRSVTFFRFLAISKIYFQKIYICHKMKMIYAMNCTNKTYWSIRTKEQSTKAYYSLKDFSISECKQRQLFSIFQRCFWINR